MFGRDLAISVPRCRSSKCSLPLKGHGPGMPLGGPQHLSGTFYSVALEVQKDEDSRSFFYTSQSIEIAPWLSAPSLCPGGQVLLPVTSSLICWV